MAQFASDTFTGTSGTELSAYNAAWTRHTVASTATIDGRISSANRLRGVGSGGGAAVYYHSGSPAGSDYSVTVDVTEMSDAMYGAGPCARMDTVANTFYYARWYTVGATDVIQLYRFVAGAVTQLGSDVNANFTTGTTRALKLEVTGTGATVTVNVYIDGSGTPSITYPDTDATRITATGKAGFRLGYGGSSTPSDTTCLHLDNFSADDVGGGGPTAYFQDVSGSLTGTGALTKQTGKALVGSSTFSAALSKITSKYPSGSMTGDGSLAKQTSKSFAGSMTAAGDLSTMILFTCMVDGSLTVTGAISKLTLKALSGASELSGAITKAVFKNLDGSVTVEGVLTKLTKKAFDGSVTVAGALTESYQVLKSLAGSITPSGALATLYIAFVAGVTKFLALLGVGS